MRTLLLKLTALHHALLFAWWRIAGRWVMARAGVRVAPGLRCYGLPIVTCERGATIDIGADVVLHSDPRFTALGVAHPVVLRAMRPGARLVIGRDVGASGASICAASSVEIGEGCLIGAGVEISDTDFHPVEPEGRRHAGDADAIGCEPVRIGPNVFLGAGVRVLKGAQIGEGSVIGAGAVVTGSIPAGSIAAGVPARVIGRVPSKAR